MDVQSRATSNVTDRKKINYIKQNHYFPQSLIV